MAMIGARFGSFLFLLLTIIGLSTAEIRHTSIRSDARQIIPFNEFGFTHNGVLELNVSRISISDTNTNPSGIGFFVSTLDAWIHVLQQLTDGDITCVLQSHLIKRVLTFNSVHSDHADLTFNVTEPGDFALVLANCVPNVKITMEVRSSMYNVDQKTGARDYLPAGYTNLPLIYFLFFFVYASLSVVWIVILYHKRLTAFRIHYFMLVVVVLKSLNLLFEAEDKLHVKRTGTAHGWDVLFYIFSFLKGIMLFTVIVLIGTGWSFVKPFLQTKEKRVLMVVIPLQVIANVAQVAVDESGPYWRDWYSWKQVFMLVDIICCCAVLFPIVWSIKNLREAARTDGKAAVNLMKLTLFRHYYVVVVCYIYFTRVIVYALSTITTYRYVWTSVVAGELATLAFFVYTGHKFKPEAYNPYFVVNDEDEEAAAAKLEGEFEL